MPRSGRRLEEAGRGSVDALTNTRFEGLGVARRAAHPDAAILFFEFMLTDGQDILLERDFFPARRDSRPIPGDASLTFIDGAKGLDEDPKGSRHFRDIMINQTR